MTLYKNRSHQEMARSWAPHYLWICKGNAQYEPTHNMFGNAVENGKSHTILLDSFITGHQYIKLQVFNMQKGIVRKE